MDQIMIDIEDNENSGYFPIQVFEVQSEPRSAAMIIITDMPGANEPYDVVGWSSTGGGTACEATAVTISDSGSGQATMIHGGDFGIRTRPSSSSSDWSIKSEDQKGEPYLLLETSVELLFQNESKPHESGFE